MQKSQKPKSSWVKRWRLLHKPLTPAAWELRGLLIRPKLPESRGTTVCDVGRAVFAHAQSVTARATCALRRCEYEAALAGSPQRGLRSNTLGGAGPNDRRCGRGRTDRMASSFRIRVSGCRSL